MKAEEHIIKSITVFKINPNEQELNKDVPFDRNVDGRIFMSCLVTINDGVAIIKNKTNNEVLGVFSLNQFYLLNTD